MMRYFLMTMCLLMVVLGEPEATNILNEVHLCANHAKNEKRIIKQVNTHRMYESATRPIGDGFLAVCGQPILLGMGTYKSSNCNRRPLKKSVECLNPDNWIVINAQNHAETDVFEATTCAGKNMTATCSKSTQKIIVNSTRAGVSKHRACNHPASHKTSPQICKDCCNVTSDCCNIMNDSLMSRKCTGKSTCQSIPEQSNITCGNVRSHMVTPSYYSIQYFCVEDFRFGDCNSSVIRSCKNGQTLYLASPDYPNYVSKPVTCLCWVESDCNETVDAIKIDIQISGSEYIDFNDSKENQFNKRGDDYTISEQYTSKTNFLLLNSTLVNGKFLIAIKASCVLTIRCPHDSGVFPSNCITGDNNSASGTVSKDFPWYAVVIPVLFVAISCTIVIGIYKHYKKRQISVAPGVNSLTGQTLIPPCSGEAKSNNIDVNDDANMFNKDENPLLEFSRERNYTNIAPLSRTINGNRIQLDPLTHEGRSRENYQTRKKKKKKRKKKHKENEQEENSNDEIVRKEEVNEKTNEKDKTKRKKKKKHHNRDQEGKGNNAGASSTESDINNYVTADNKNIENNGLGRSFDNNETIANNVDFDLQSYF